jgi:type IV pilus assembly protein PilW
MQPLFIYSMKNKVNSPRSIRGFSLIELMVSMAITLVIVVAASLVFLSVREADNIQSKASDSLETGVFALQVIGRDLAQAGSYPVVMPPTTQYFPTGRWMEFYPPTNWSTELSAAPYQSGIFGCDGGTFSSITGACTASTAMTPYRSAPDSMVINYFSMEAANTPTGNRRDCTGSDAGRDSINAVRKLNTVPDTAVSPPVPTVEDKDLPPYRPVFVSNRFALSAIHSIEVDKQPVNTRSLACNGNGMNGSQPGDAATANLYQPLLLGIEDLQITYGVSPIAGVGTAMSLAPDRFYTATQVDAMATVTFDGVNYPPWDRVTAVRVCMMTRTLGGATRLQDKTGAASTYLDCTDDTAQSYAAGANFILKRHIQTFALRGRLTQTY